MIDKFKSDAACLELLIASRRVRAACEAAEDAATDVRNLADRLGNFARQCRSEADRLAAMAVAALRGDAGDA